MTEVYNPGVFSTCNAHVTFWPTNALPRLGTRNNLMGQYKPDKVSEASMISTPFFL